MILLDQYSSSPSLVTSFLTLGFYTYNILSWISFSLYIALFLSTLTEFAYFLREFKYVWNAKIWLLASLLGMSLCNFLSFFLSFLSFLLTNPAFKILFVLTSLYPHLSRPHDDQDIISYLFQACSPLGVDLI